jgi:hypothetical protein
MVVSGGGAATGSERGTDRNRILAISRSKNASRLCRQARAHRGGRDNDHAGVQWAARTQRSNGIGSGGKRSEGSSPGAISRPARIDPRNERRSPERWRFRPHASVGVTIGKASAQRTGGGSASEILGRCLSTAGVILHRLWLAHERRSIHESQDAAGVKGRHTRCSLEGRRYEP